MNEPIINPWFFYLASRADAMICVCAAMIVAGSIMVLYHFLSKLFDEGEYPRMLKIGIRIVIVFAVLLCIIPSEQTLYKMLLAHYATPDNINDVANMIIDGARRIAEATNG